MVHFWSYLESRTLGMEWVCRSFTSSMWSLYYPLILRRKLQDQRWELVLFPPHCLGSNVHPSLPSPPIDVMANVFLSTLTLNEWTLINYQVFLPCRLPESKQYSQIFKTHVKISFGRCQKSLAFENSQLLREEVTVFLKQVFSSRLTAPH